jgi:hypothetical protein
MYAHFVIDWLRVLLMTLLMRLEYEITWLIVSVPNPNKNDTSSLEYKRFGNFANSSYSLEKLGYPHASCKYLNPSFICIQNLI